MQLIKSQVSNVKLIFYLQWPGRKFWRWNLSTQQLENRRKNLTFLTKKCNVLVMPGHASFFEFTGDLLPTENSFFFTLRLFANLPFHCLASQSLSFTHDSIHENPLNFYPPFLPLPTKTFSLNINPVIWPLPIGEHHQHPEEISEHIFNLWPLLRRQCFPHSLSSADRQVPTPRSLLWQT